MVDERINCKQFSLTTISLTLKVISKSFVPFLITPFFSVFLAYTAKKEMILPLERLYAHFNQMVVYFLHAVIRHSCLWKRIEYLP